MTGANSVTRSEGREPLRQIKELMVGFRDMNRT